MISNKEERETGKIMFVLSDGLESRLRKVAERKGDLSIIAEEALDAWIEKIEVGERFYDWRNKLTVKMGDEKP